MKLRNVLLLVLTALGIAMALAARRKVIDAEVEAALWAEATDPVTPQQ